jgi:hypothetical protein
MISLNNGQILFKLHTAELAGNWCMKAKRFFKMDVCSYSWLHMFDIEGFAQKDLNVKKSVNKPK